MKQSDAFDKKTLADNLPTQPTGPSDPRTAPLTASEDKQFARRDNKTPSSDNRRLLAAIQALESGQGKPRKVSLKP